MKTSELSLDDSGRHISSALSIAALARQEKFSTLFVPAENASEASLFEELIIFPIDSLLQLVDYLTGYKISTPDLSKIKGQERGNRALEVMAGATI